MLPTSSFRTVLSLSVLLLVSSASPGGLSLPLQGYYRPGAYMPVKVDGGVNQIDADGVLPTVIEGDAPSIVPVLVVNSPARLSPGMNLQPLGENEILVACSPDAIIDAPSLFPKGRIVPISVDPLDLLTASPALWETLDAIILDSAIMNRLDDDRRSALLAGDVMLAATGNSPPDSKWPWKHRGALWIIQHDPVGPPGQIVNPAAYSPTYAWMPGHPAIIRGETVIAGAILGILVLTITLSRSRFALIPIIIVAGISTAAVVSWRRSLPFVNQTGGDVLAASNGLIQQDSWLYERARDDGIRRIDWDGSTHPAISSIDQIPALQMRMIVKANGNLAFEYHAKRGQTVAFMRRMVRPGNVPVPSALHSSPMTELVKDVYLSQGWRIAGEQPAASGQWNSVVIEKVMPTSDR